jgi:hypothetical protein
MTQNATSWAPPQPVVLVYKPYPSVCSLRCWTDHVFQAGASVAKNILLKQKSQTVQFLNL